MTLLRLLKSTGTVFSFSTSNWSIQTFKLVESDFAVSLDVSTSAAPFKQAYIV